MLPGSRCKFCRVKFSPEEKDKGLRLHLDCIGPYAESFAGRLQRKKAAKAKQLKAQESRELRGRKAALKRIPDLLKETQIACNAYIRERDRDLPCICCARPLGAVVGVGGAYDAGHYRSVGSAPHLRFDERNIHAQRKDCNRYGAGRAVDYRIGLIQRIGLEAVESLESDNGTHKWTRDELTAIRDTYKQKLKELKACAT
jgi:hypothetical protein